MLAEPAKSDHILKHVADESFAVHHLGNGGNVQLNSPGCDAPNPHERLDAQTRGERDDSNAEAEVVNPLSRKLQACGPERIFGFLHSLPGLLRCEAADSRAMRYLPQTGSGVKALSAAPEAWKPARKQPAADNLLDNRALERQNR
jgi:hypothetical protein